MAPATIIRNTGGIFDAGLDHCARIRSAWCGWHIIGTRSIVFDTLSGVTVRILETILARRTLAHTGVGVVFEQIPFNGRDLGPQFIKAAGSSGLNKGLVAKLLQVRLQIHIRTQTPGLSAKNIILLDRKINATTRGATSSCYQDATR